MSVKMGGVGSTTFGKVGHSTSFTSLTSSDVISVGTVGLAVVGLPLGSRVRCVDAPEQIDASRSFSRVSL